MAEQSSIGTIASIGNVNLASSVQPDGVRISAAFGESLQFCFRSEYSSLGV